MNQQLDGFHLIVKVDINTHMHLEHFHCGKVVSGVPEGSVLVNYNELISGVKIIIWQSIFLKTKLMYVTSKPTHRLLPNTHCLPSEQYFITILLSMMKLFILLIWFHHMDTIHVVLLAFVNLTLYLKLPY